MTVGAGPLSGKRALVTGSTQGLGAAVARRFAAEGARVVITGRNQARGNAVADALGARCAGFVPADLADVDDCRNLAQETVRLLGGVDILVNSAGLPERSTVHDFTPEHFDRVFHVNVRAPMLLAQALIPQLRERTGVIINIGSVNAYIGAPSLFVYAASKGALMTASRNLGAGLQTERVRVHVLNIGWMDSDGERVIQAQQGKGPEFMAEAGKRSPMGRLLSPEEIAGACAYLCRDEAAAFSGGVIDLEQFPVGTWGGRQPPAPKSPPK